MILKKIYSPKLIHSKIVAIQPQLSLAESLRSNYRKNTSDFFGNAPENIVISDRVLDSISFENKDRVICALNYLMYRLGWQKGPIPKEYHSLFIKMIQIVGHVIPGLEASSIPPGFKDNLKIGNVLDFTLNVISIMQRKAFSDDIPLLEAYNAEVLKIKASLIEAGHPKALNWFARTDFLFFWCRALIEKTAHPMLQTLKRLPASQYLDGDLDRKKVHKFLSNFWDTLSKFVLFVVFVDDVADDIQDPTLLKPFLDIPGEVNWDGTLDDSSEQHIRDIATTHPEFSGFFRLYVNTWTDCIKEVRALVGDDVLMKAYWPSLIEAVRDVLKSMSFSVSLNLNPQEYRGKIERIEADLAVNMLMSFYKTLEAMILHSCYGRVPKTAELTPLFTLGEVIGHSGNNLATLRREITQGDLSNTLIFMIDSCISSYLSLSRRSFNSFIQHFSSHLVIPGVGEKSFNFISLLDQVTNIDKHVSKLIAEIINGVEPTSEKARYLANLVKIKTVEKMIAWLDSQTLASPHISIRDEIRRLLDEKRQYLDLIDSILVDPRITALLTYYDRIQVDLEHMYEIKDELRHPGMGQYIEGVRDLFVMYLVFKSDM